MIILLSLTLLLILTRSREGFLQAAGDVGQPVHPVSSGTYIRSDAMNCMARAVDRAVPIKPGPFTKVAGPDEPVMAAMKQAVHIINCRCRTDFAKVAVDDPYQEVDAAGNIQYSGRVHLYSPKLNVARTVTLSALRGPVVGGGPRQLYLVSAVPLTSCSEDRSGVEPATLDFNSGRCSGVMSSDYLLV